MAALVETILTARDSNLARAGKAAACGILLACDDDRLHLRSPRASDPHPGVRPAAYRRRRIVRLSKVTSSPSKRFSPASSKPGWRTSRLTRSSSWPATMISRWRLGASLTGLRCHYLQDAGLELFGLQIWGTPWQPWFYDWAFNAPRHDGEAFLASKFEAAIPADTDIIVAHGPPRGFGDRTRQTHVGSTAMTATLERVQPRSDGVRPHPSRLRSLPPRRDRDHQRLARRRGLSPGQSRDQDRALTGREFVSLESEST